MFGFSAFSETPFSALPTTAEEVIEEADRFVLTPTWMLANLLTTRPANPYATASTNSGQATLTTRPAAPYAISMTTRRL